MRYLMVTSTYQAATPNGYGDSNFDGLVEASLPVLISTLNRAKADANSKFINTLDPANPLNNSGLLVHRDNPAIKNKYASFYPGNQNIDETRYDTYTASVDGLNYVTCRLNLNSFGVDNSCVLSTKVGSYNFAIDSQ